MGIPGSANPLLLVQQGSTQYTVSRSIRLNSSDSAYLSRTPSSAGNRKTWTWSGWVKRTKLGEPQILFVCFVNSSNYSTIEFYSTTDQIRIANVVAGVEKAALLTTQVFRDPSSWYHIVVASNSSSSLKLYVNGSEVTQFSVTTGPDASDWSYNSTNAHDIGRYSSGYYFNGYLANVEFVDGQQLTPSSFGETNATTGQWVPKAFSGSYGSQGWKLDFSDNSAATAAALGKDTSPNGNNWTPTNLSVTAGAGNDSLVDTPVSSGTDAGNGGEVRGNYCTWSAVDKGSNVNLANGNLDTSQTATGIVRGTIGVSSGKWYWEYTCAASTSNAIMIGIATAQAGLGISSVGGDAYSWGYYGVNGQKYTNNSGASYGASFTTNDVIGVALDADNGTLTFYKNGTSQGQAYSGLTSGPYFPAVGTTNQNGSANFGQRPFAYTAPSGFKALVDTNLPSPQVAKPSSAFDCVTYTGTGATLTPTSSLGFSPDLVWIKSRSAATDNTIYDAVRGAQARLESNNTDAEVTSDGGLTAFNSNGFTLGTLAQVNTNAATYVAWCWDEAVADGFDIVTYTGNGANRTIAHSLGVAPSLMIVKQRTAASTTNWAVWHSSLANTEYLLLNSAAAKATGATYWNSTSPTGSVFSLGTSTDVNANNGTYVAYLWSPVAGYSTSFSYTGNGSADGVFQFLGFRPRLILLKCSSTTGNWTLLDTARAGYNVDNDPLYPNLSNAEGTTDLLDITSNGFKLRTTDASVNSNGATYVGFAWAESPFQYARAR